MRLSRLFSACPALAVLAFATAAVAHPLVEDGLEHLRAADFRAAMTTFDRAEAATDLTLPDVVLLLEGRAMAALAMGDEAAEAENLARLAALEPDHRFGAEAPPEIRTAFDRARAAHPARLTLEVRSTREDDAVVLEVVVEGDPGGLVRSVRLSARPAGGAWQDWDEPTARLPARPDQAIEAHASARGPGGAVIADAATRASPIRIPPASGGGAGGGGSGEHDDESEDGGGAATWAWIGAGAAVVAAAVVLTAVALSSSGPSDLTQPRSPEMP